MTPPAPPGPAGQVAQERATDVVDQLEGGLRHEKAGEHGPTVPTERSEDFPLLSARGQSVPAHPGKAGHNLDEPLSLT